MHKSEIVGRDLVDRNVFVNNDEIFVSKSPFSAFEEHEKDELVFKGSKDFFKSEQIILKVQNGQIKIKDDDSIDLDILIAIDELEFATSRMIAIYLNLKGISIKQKTIQNRLRVLNNSKIISAYELRSIDSDGNEKTFCGSIYCLDIGSSLIFRSQGIKSPFRAELALKPKKYVKEILARNQLMLTYIQEIKNILYTKNNPFYSLSTGKQLIPHLQIVFEYQRTKQHMFFEVIRSFTGWKDKLLEQIFNYKTFLEEFQPSKAIPNIPIVVLVAEDDKHAFNILKVIMENNLLAKNYSYLFTTDTRILTQEIHKSIFNFLIEEDVAKIQILNTELFIA